MDKTEEFKGNSTIKIDKFKEKVMMKITEFMKGEIIKPNATTVNNLVT